MATTLDGGAAAGLPKAPSGLTTCQYILFLAQQQLADETGQTYNDSNLIPYINLGINEIISLKPEANSQIVTGTLVAGSRQVADTVFGEAVIDILNVDCNMDSNGNRGRAIHDFPKIQMDALVPDWNTYDASDVIRYAIMDSVDTRNFYVFPPSKAGVKVSALLSILPDAITDSLIADFPLDDSYMPALVDYVVGRAMMEETSIPNAQAKGQVFMKKFITDLGIKTQIEEKTKKETQ